MGHPPPSLLRGPSLESGCWPRGKGQRITRQPTIPYLPSDLDCGPGGNLREHLWDSWLALSHCVTAAQSERPVTISTRPSIQGGPLEGRERVLSPTIKPLQQERVSDLSKSTDDGQMNHLGDRVSDGPGCWHVDGLGEAGSDPKKAGAPGWKSDVPAMLRTRAMLGKQSCWLERERKAQAKSLWSFQTSSLPWIFGFPLLGPWSHRVGLWSKPRGSEPLQDLSPRLTFVGPWVLAPDQGPEGGC